MPKVYNRHHHDAPPDAVYIGRGSKWGNPYSHMHGTKAEFVVATREEAVANYRQYLLNNPDLLADLPELRGKDLVCYCAPLACHGDVLLELTNSQEQEKKMKPLYIMGTGSRSFVLHPRRVEMYEHLKETVLKHREKSYEEGLELVLISGMAEGWDEAIAKVGYREGIPYICIVPNPGYGEYYWGKNSLLGINRLDTFNQLVTGAREVRYTSQGQLYVNGVHVNFLRNQQMVDLCSFAYIYGPTSSGTKDAVARLRKAGKLEASYVFPVLEAA